MCLACVCFQIANGCAGACHLHGRVIRCAVGRFVLQSDAVFAWRIRSCDIVTPVAVLVSTSQIAHSIRDGGDGSLLHKSNTSLKPAAPLATSSESAAAVASSSKASARPLHLCAPDAHPEVTNRLLAFIGVPIPTVAAASPSASAAPVSVASPNDPPPPHRLLGSGSRARRQAMRPMR